jgi:hypothetical protein
MEVARDADASPAAARTLRLGQFNIRELTKEKIMAVDAEGVGNDPQTRAAATIIQRVRPDVLIINEIDHDYSEQEQLDLNARRFEANYLATGEAPIRYPYAYAAPCNTGILSGVDLDANGNTATSSEEGERDHGNDAFGYGVYPGQYSMAILSRFPLDAAAARTFQTFRWVDMPDAVIPPGHYSEQALAIFRLSSKSHWDVPLTIDGLTIHLLVSHPTPPGFDGPEDRNGRRNFDEIRFWQDYINGADYIYDDAGGRGGLAAGAIFAIMGDQNCDADDTKSKYHGAAAITHLIADPLVRDTAPWMRRANARDGVGTPANNEWGTPQTHGSGRRLDYILTSPNVTPVGGGVFFPQITDDRDGHALAGEASDHQMTWLDLRW